MTSMIPRTLISSATRSVPLSLSRRAIPSAVSTISRRRFGQQTEKEESYYKVPKNSMKWAGMAAGAAIGATALYFNSKRKPDGWVHHLDSEEGPIAANKDAAKKRLNKMVQENDLVQVFRLRRKYQHSYRPWPQIFFHADALIIRACYRYRNLACLRVILQTIQGGPISRLTNSDIKHKTLRTDNSGRKAVYSALAGAVARGDLEMTKVFIEAGFYPDDCDDCRGSAKVALERGHFAMLSYLVDKQAIDLNKCSRFPLSSVTDTTRKRYNGYTPVYFAANMLNGKRRERALEFLKRKGADFTDPVPLVKATKRGDAEAVKLLLRHGADPDAPYKAVGDGVGHRGIILATPLMSAIRSDDIATARILLENGATATSLMPPRIHQPGDHEKVSKVITPLSIAVHKNNPPMVELLIAHGATVDDLVEQEDFFTLRSAAEGGSPETLKALISSPVYPDTRSQPAKMKAMASILKAESDKCYDRKNATGNADENRCRLLKDWSDRVLNNKWFHA